MSISCTLKKTVLSILFLSLLSLAATAADESYLQTLQGKIKKGDSLNVVDDKFLNLPLDAWNQIHNISVNNIISFELRNDTAFNYYNKSFTCTLNLTVKYFTSHDQQSPTELDNISLVVKYDTASGKYYPVNAQYSFKNAFKVTVVVNSISSPEWGNDLPNIFRIKSQILVKRKYPFTEQVTAPITVTVGQDQGTTQPSTRLSTLTLTEDNKLNISWSASDFPGAEEYDVEWTYVDNKSGRGAQVASHGTGGVFMYSLTDLEGWMHNDNTRVTLSTTSCSINLPYTDGYVLVRVRGASYDDNNLRITTDWQYQDASGNAACQAIAAHQSNLNWQYTGTFAEEGKHKEVISYFDGTLRNRQTVTVNNEDKTALVAETIYDKMGRPAVNVLPYPVLGDDHAELNSKLQYYPTQNLNSASQPYSYRDITASTDNSCIISAQAMNTASGAAQYYSSNNNILKSSDTHNPQYLNYKYFTNYVPDAEGFPMTLTEYTPDNTGRIRRQSGVGYLFNNDNQRKTQYYYSKPLPKDLERLFGMEVGNASHYLKNIVVDPNGQISVSYVDANGKTIATALAGDAPKSLDPLSSSGGPQARTRLNQTLINPTDLDRDGSSLQMHAAAMFFAAVTGTFQLHYSVNPAALTTTPQHNSQFCTNCFYQVQITVNDDCGNQVAQASSTPFTGNDIICHSDAAVIVNNLDVPVTKIGEYTVNYTLQLSEDVINQQVDYYIQNNTDLKTLQSFFQDEMIQADLKGCYSECSTCLVKLGTKADFTSKMNTLLEQLKEEKYSGQTFDVNAQPIKDWISNKYDELLLNCQTISSACAPPSPCEQKLEMLKYDVRPGGQYAVYDPVTFTVPASEQAVSVLLNYKTDDRIPNYDFVDENGVTHHIKDAAVTQDVFIKAYIQHPEWADAFVLRHVEYCSYLWCKDQSNPHPAQNNEVSYTFDETLKEQITTGELAVQKGYYDRTNFNALVNVDPFFNGGYGTSYKTSMQNDLASLSTAIHMIVKDANSNVQPSKNILQLIDWSLYCKPLDPNATSQQVLDSWNSCVPTSVCRSLTSEWELYRNYYLQVKSKYMQMAKQAHDPSCANCFVGDDGVAASLVKGSGDCPTYRDFNVEQRTVYQNLQDPPDPTTDIQDASYDIYYVYKNGTPLTRPVQVNIYSSHTYLNGGQSSNYLTTDPPILVRTVTMNVGDKELYLGTKTVHYSYDIRADWYNYYNDSYDYSASIPSCPILPAPSSSCTTDARYNDYKDKTRVFDDYVDMDTYLNYMVNGGLPSQPDPNNTYMRDQATSTLDDLKTAWTDRLTAVRDEESAFSTITDNQITSLVNALYLVAKNNIEVTTDDIRPASTLPPGTVPTSNYVDFKAAFTGIIGASLMQKGFGPELLDQPYPYGKKPVMVNDNSGTLSILIHDNITALHSRFGNGTDEQFHYWLKNELQDDYTLTLPQLQDLLTRCNNNCRMLEEPLSLPVAFTAPNGQAWKTCSEVNQVVAGFNSDYPSIEPDSKLYRLLFTNYLNFNLGYTLSYEEYQTFLTTCSDPLSTAVLYNKPASPLIQDDDDACTAGIMSNIFEHAGQEYALYIDDQRKEFKNQLVSKCLSNSASLNLEGDQYEYHYTLYYYDQSGNLVKTIPPEGVHLLSDADLYLVEEFKAQDPTQCSGVGVPATEDRDATFNGFSTQLQNSAVHAVEMWLYSGAASTNRQVRVITPDHKYFYQVAISNNKLWAELYSLQPNAANDIDVIASTKAAADISDLPSLQSWSHVVIQTADNLATGTLQLYLDGHKLTNLPSGSEPAYPFEWGIDASSGVYTLPSEDLAALKHFRAYSLGRTLTDEEILANYKNDCLSPVGNLVSLTNPQLVWGRFNIPTPGSETTIGAGSTVEYNNHFVVPNHFLSTNYAYNSMNQVVQQTSPDGGTSQFWYDRLSRLAVSQNAEQKQPAVVNTDNPAGRYSYTRYDALGRITEVGEKLNAIPATEGIIRGNSIDDWYNSGNNRQVTITAYDEAPSWAPTTLLGQQHNLRKRVTATALLSTAVNTADPSVNRLAASYYSYDLIGNVSDLFQENTAQASKEGQYLTGTDGLKHIKYEYDLVSGKVNKVLYQDGKWDQFYYRYIYDEENRLTDAYSSRINYTVSSELSNWIREAHYRYYLHGPLARMELGKNNVQGLDYAYTLQGWLKGVNSQFLDPNKDMAGDGQSSSFALFARDAISFSLGYYQNDYKPISSTTVTTFNLSYTPNADQSQSGADLYNGNISHATYAFSKLNNGATIGYTYRYDQLNRLTAMDQQSITVGSTNWDNTSISEAYKERISYDANGNIKTYLRNRDGGTAMDNLTYGYNVDENGRLVNNKLRHVKDAVAVHDQGDIGNQADDNYTYDQIGNLIADQAENIDHITWTVYGKIASIVKKDGTTITYGYDANGNRITKLVQTGSPSTVITTYYVRDAHGNVLGVYSDKTGDQAGYTWKEQHLYGSSRLGMVNPNFFIPSGQPLGNDQYSSTNDPSGNGIEGLRTYELANHLGNVLATISDKHIGVGQGSSMYYTADVLSTQDYYPFGMGMPGKSFTITNYEYGFGGQQKDNEIKGEGNSYTAPFWEYDPRIGRRWNIDPVPKTTLSSYVVLGNDPISFVDPSGADWYQNKKSGGYDWFDGSGRHKGYKHMRTNHWSTRNANNVSYYFGNSKDGLLMDSGNPLDNVTVTAKGKKHSLIDQAPLWQAFNKSVQEYPQWKSGLNQYYQRINSGSPLFQAGDDSYYTSNLDNYERFYQAEQDWRTMQMITFVDFPSMFVPIPKLGALKWLRYGGRTFQEAKIAIWAKNTKPIFQIIRNETTGQTFKIFAEIHHEFIPQRWGWPNWITNSSFNLQITNSIEHGLIDQYRYQFFPRWVKEGIEAGQITKESVIRVK
jgi:RHS repeat-associated protein